MHVRALIGIRQRAANRPIDSEGHGYHQNAGQEDSIRTDAKQFPPSPRKRVTRRVEARAFHHANCQQAGGKYGKRLVCPRKDEPNHRRNNAPVAREKRVLRADGRGETVPPGFEVKDSRDFKSAQGGDDNGGQQGEERRERQRSEQFICSGILRAHLCKSLRQKHTGEASRNDEQADDEGSVGCNARKRSPCVVDDSAGGVINHELGEDHEEQAEGDESAVGIAKGRRAPDRGEGQPHPCRGVAIELEAEHAEDENTSEDEQPGADLTVDFGGLAHRNEDQGTQVCGDAGREE